jgi:hypothetical protein
MAEENPDMEFAKKLPSQLREDIGACFSKVLSDDPSVKIPATRSFMAHLQTAMTGALLWKNVTRYRQTWDFWFTAGMEPATGNRSV